jgi:polysaccharide deacetylase family protein (PEP-CTERM system associated)
MPGGAADIRNALSIDFEDWYQAFAARSIPGWDQYPTRVPRDTERLLTLLDKYKVRCTFFMLGDVAEKFRSETLAIHRAGHEIGSHGYRHLPLYRQDPAVFERETEASKKFLEDLTGAAVLGFRAPFFSVREETRWAIDALHRIGFKYDTSINPIAGSLHGYTGAARSPYTHPNGLHELPITTLRLPGLTVPFGGGMWYRLLPYPAIRTGLRRLARRGVAGNIYFHPREFDPDLPRIKAGWKMYLINYAGTATLERKLERMLRDFTWVPVKDYLQEQLPGVSLN